MVHLLPNIKKEEIRAKNREYQRGRQACQKTEPDASKLIASSGIKYTRMDEKGNSYKRKQVMASQENNIGICFGFSVHCLCIHHFQLFALFILAKIRV
jgi:hypothetical protein